MCRCAAGGWAALGAAWVVTLSVIALSEMSPVNRACSDAEGACTEAGRKAFDEVPHQRGPTRTSGVAGSRGVVTSVGGDVTDSHVAIFNTAQQLRHANRHQLKVRTDKRRGRTKDGRQRRPRTGRRPRRRQRGGSERTDSGNDRLGRTGSDKSGRTDTGSDWPGPTDTGVYSRHLLPETDAVHGGMTKASRPVPLPRPPLDITGARRASDDVTDEKREADDVNNAQREADDVTDTRRDSDDVTDARRESEDVTGSMTSSDDDTAIAAVPIQISNASSIFEKVKEYVSHFDDDYQFPDYVQPSQQKGNWSEWGACDVTCGPGQQERTRSCGSDCFETEQRECWEHCGDDDGRSVDEKLATETASDRTASRRNPTPVPAVDECGEWLRCAHPFHRSYLRAGVAGLPNCPCEHPTDLARDDRVWDAAKGASFRWHAAEPLSSQPSHALRVYKPGARRCMRSQLQPGSLSFAAQHCCYDDANRLITRGRAAGTPSLVSPEMSEALHHKIDLLPWIICKGDWTRYNKARPPNNGRGCAENPDTREYEQQVKDARNY